MALRTDVERLHINQCEGRRSIQAGDDRVRAVPEAGTRPCHELLQGGATPRALSDDTGRAKEGIQADNEGMDCGVVAGAREADTMAAGGEVAVARADVTLGGRKVGATGSADGDVSLALNWGEEEEVDGQGDWEGRRLLLKGEERGMGTLRALGDRDATPEGERPTSRAAIEEACTADGGGEGRVIEGEEVVRCNQCRGGPRTRYVASYITSIQVIQHTLSVAAGVVAILIASGIQAKSHGGRREAAIDKARVEARERDIRREEVIKVASEGEGCVSGGQAAPGLLDSLDMATAACLGQLLATQWDDPGAHVVPHRRPRAIVGGVMV